MPQLNTLANRLRAARLHAGATQTELAATASLSRTTVSAAEAGLKTPARATVILWALSCGVDSHWLFTGEESK